MEEQEHEQLTSAAVVVVIIIISFTEMKTCISANVPFLTWTLVSRAEVCWSKSPSCVWLVATSCLHVNDAAETNRTRELPVQLWRRGTARIWRTNKNIKDNYHSNRLLSMTHATLHDMFIITTAQPIYPPVCPERRHTPAIKHYFSTDLQRSSRRLFNLQRNVLNATFRCLTFIRKMPRALRRHKYQTYR